MANQPAVDFKEAGFKPTGKPHQYGFQAGYILINDKEVLHSSLIEGEGTLLKTFRFDAARPEVRTRLKNGDEIEERGTVPMSKYDTRELSAAYIALLQLGGSPFDLQKQLAPKAQKVLFGKKV